MLKICLISFGILLALCFYDYLIGLMWLWWMLFIVETLYFLVRLFITEK